MFAEMKDFLWSADFLFFLNKIFWNRMGQTWSKTAKMKSIWSLYRGGGSSSLFSFFFISEEFSYLMLNQVIGFTFSLSILPQQTFILFITYNLDVVG